MPDIMRIATEGMKFAQMGRVKEAAECFRALSVLSPNPTSEIMLATLLPAIYESKEELQTWRQRLEFNLRSLVHKGVRLDVSENYAPPEFFAQYQGYDDREIQQLRGRLYIAPQSPSCGQPRQRGPGDRIRVGLLSKYFKNHTIGRLSQGLVAMLPREEYEVTVFSVAPASDPIAEFFKTHADAYVQLPASLPAMRQLIADRHLDILHFTDLGMDPVSYTLALSRLAPVQCTTWGHPVTSGLPTVDYFISAEGLEPPNSEGQYSERLVKLKDLAVYYYRPTIASEPARSEFGLPDDAHLYGCLQSLYKFHPEFDEVLAGILRGDPKALIVLLSGQYIEWDQFLMKRLAASMPTQRIRLMPRTSPEGFLRLNRVCDVMLDPPHFGGGNTTYEALALGRPVITLPSGLLRGRLAYKMYETMGMFDCVVQTIPRFIELALRLGTDADFAREIRARIEARCGILFENQAGIRQLAEFWKSAVSRSPSGAVG